MSTRLAGPDSVFLPFNQGFDFGAGNPTNPNDAARPACGRPSGTATAGWQSSAATSLGAALIERDLLNEKIAVLEANRPLARRSRRL